MGKGELTRGAILDQATHMASRVGFAGLSMATVLILAQLFPPRESTGLLLPLLISGDIFAVLSFRRHADWYQIWRMLPPTIIGIVGALLGGFLVEVGAMLDSRAAGVQRGHDPRLAVAVRHDDPVRARSCADDGCQLLVGELLVDRVIELGQDATGGAHLDHPRSQPQLRCEWIGVRTLTHLPQKLPPLSLRRSLPGRSQIHGSEIRHPDASRWGLDAALLLVERSGRDDDARALLQQSLERCEDPGLQSKIEAAMKALQVPETA